VPIVSAFLLFALKKQLLNASGPIFMLICKETENKEIMRDRAERAGFALYKWFYYLGSSIAGYYLLKDTDLLPW
jgi:hypothetical protein